MCLDGKPSKTSVKCGIQPSKVEQDFSPKHRLCVFIAGGKEQQRGILAQQ